MTTNVINFYEYRPPRAGHNDTAYSRRPFQYRCQIETRFQIAPNVMLWMLEGVDTNNDDEVDHNAMQDFSRSNLKTEIPNELPLSPIRSETRKDLQLRTEDRFLSSDEQEFFQRDEDKEITRIEIQKLSLIPQSHQSYSILIEENGVTKPYTPKTIHEGTSSTRNLKRATFFPDGDIAASQAPSVESKRVHKEVSKMVIPEEQEEEEEQQQQKVKEAKESVKMKSENNVQIMSRLEALKNYKKVLKINHIPTPMKRLIYGFITVIIILLVKAVAFQVVTSGKSAQALCLKGNLADMEVQKFHLISLQDSVIQLWALTKERKSHSNSTQIAVSVNQTNVQEIADKISNDLRNLAYINRKLLTSKLSLSTDIHQNFFNRKTRIFESASYDTEQKYFDVNNFQDIDFLIQNLRGALTHIPTNLTLSIPQLKLVTRNALNTILENSEINTNVMFESLKLSQNPWYRLIHANLCLNVLLMIVLFCIFTRLVWIECQAQKRDMTSFAHLNIFDINMTLRKLYRFQTVLQSGLQLGHKWSEYHLRIFDKSVKYEDKVCKAENNTRKVSCKGIHKRFLKYFTKVLSLYTILFLALSLNLLYFEKTVKFSYKIIFDMHYIDVMREKIALSHVTITELIISNDTSRIYNQPASSQLAKSIEDLNEFIENIDSGYLQYPHTSFEEDINTVLFGEACQFIRSTGSTCSASLGEGDHTTTNYLSVLSDFRYHIKAFQDDYEQSTKTLASLSEIYTRANNTLSPQLNILLQFNSILSAHLTKAFEVSLGPKTFIGLFTEKLHYLVLFFVPFSTWFGTFKRLKQYDNNYRKLLKVFPAYTILANTLLRRYLAKIYKTVIKSYIESDFTFTTKSVPNSTVKKTNNQHRLNSNSSR